ncbi:hypothetical protein [Pseudonocardia asaccharolytica]|uniref:Chaplin domain-containing protein n=1 Tax=Pseudonocardia asaccharolytica DSM 44247 = NBRC 16224 TaxID=1123024 RepID=A0A511D446_9PSEU|nr:hypothetical protein [Pseudonocardia asaccharolytica]GEL19545.1 hypothetical protein PA7_33820 [Pseudonocardia asaccharolytica DSM 44247 = NBRC 16224]
MLKKAGIVVATAAAGLLAVSPLAFAGDKGDWGHHHHGTDQVNSNEEVRQGLVNVSDNNVNVPVQVCNNDIPVNVLGVQVSDVTADLVGALGLLGPATATGGDLSENRACAQDAGAGDTLVQSNDD